MKLGMPIFGSPQKIGKIAEEMSPGNGAAVEEYLALNNGGYAIPIEEFIEFSSLSLDKLHKIGFHPPKHIFYLKDYPVLRRELYKRVESYNE